MVPIHIQIFILQEWTHHLKMKTQKEKSVADKSGRSSNNLDRSITSQIGSSMMMSGYPQLKSRKLFQMNCVNINNQSEVDCLLNSILHQLLSSFFINIQYQPNSTSQQEIPELFYSYVSDVYPLFNQSPCNIQIMKTLLGYMKPMFSVKKTHPGCTQKQINDQQYILLTYRSEIKPYLQTTYYTSDSGWGCMLRVGQMFIANLYYKYQKHQKLDVIRLFYDNKEVPFSIQKMTELANKLCPDKKQYQWFTPCECGRIIKEMLEIFDNKYRITICPDNCLFLSDIVTDRQNLVILLMCRIGLDKPQPQYLECVLQLFKMKHFNSILGGTPKKAHYMVKDVEGYVGFLDPHTTQKVPSFSQMENQQSQFTSKLLWVKEKYIDSSMGIAFVVPQEQLGQFWGQMQALKEQLGEKFFIYLQKQKPQYNMDDEGIIEIMDEQI